MRAEPTSPTFPHRHPCGGLRLTFEGPLSRWSAAWGVAASALQGRAVRIALPLELEDDARGHGERAIADVLAAGHAVDVMPALGGDRTLTTRSAARIHAALLPALATLPATVGVLLVCRPPPRALQAALSVEAGLWAAARRVFDIAAGVPAPVWAARQGQRDLRELARDLRDRPVVAASPPPLLPLDAPLSSAALHWVLGCPDVEADIDDGPLFGPAAALCLAPLAAVDRASQHRAFSLWAARHRERSHAIAIGPTGPMPGLPSTAMYRAPAHLQQDLAAARALGFSDITVMGLDGLVLDGEGAARPDAGAWLDAVLDAAGEAVAQAA